MVPTDKFKSSNFYSMPKAPLLQVNDKQTHGGFILSGGDRAIDFSGSGSLETRRPKAAWNTIYHIEVNNKIVQSAEVLEFNLGGSAQGLGSQTAVLKDCGFIFNEPNTHFRLGFDCLIGALR